MTKDSEGAGPVRVGGIVVHRNWDGALSVIEHARESIEILDSFFSDYNDLKRGIMLAAGNGAKRLEIHFYLASDKKKFGAQRFREASYPEPPKAKAEDNDTAYKNLLWAQEDDTTHEVSHIGKSDISKSSIPAYTREAVNAINSKKAKPEFEVDLKISEYPTMPAIRMMLVDRVHIFFGWFPLLDHNPGYFCCYLNLTASSGMEAELAKGLLGQFEIVKRISQPLYVAHR